MVIRRKFVNIFRSDDGTLIALDEQGKAWKRTVKGRPPLTSETNGEWERCVDWDSPRKPWSMSPSTVHSKSDKEAEDD